MKFALTGSDGFLGWHFRCYARTLSIGDIRLLNRKSMEDFLQFKDNLDDIDVLIHTAGTNRAENDDLIYSGNVEIAKQLAIIIRSTKTPLIVVNCNSIQSKTDSVYGKAKKTASEIIHQACIETGSRYIDLILPNLFGECGKPNYNSVVATFCHQASRGEDLKVMQDKELLLINVQDVVKRIIDVVSSNHSEPVEFEGIYRNVSQIKSLILEISSTYNYGGIPNIEDKFSRDIFNTYLSHIPSNQRLVRQESRSDERGSLHETLRVRSGQVQSFISRTKPSRTRGNHFHLNKFERFCVVEGEAVIRIRKLLSSEVFEYRVSGDDTSFIDMPTLWAHSIENVGSRDLITTFYADPLFDPRNPDTYAEQVCVRA
jgi:UDP-2-acetamido-2,6-beta-L-arabino-hexul-4-ose reductase